MYIYPTSMAALYIPYTLTFARLNCRVADMHDCYIQNMKNCIHVSMVTFYAWICLPLYMHIYAHICMQQGTVHKSTMQAPCMVCICIPSLHIDSITMLLTYQLFDSCDW